MCYIHVQEVCKIEVRLRQSPWLTDGRYYKFNVDRNKQKGPELFPASVHLHFICFKVVYV